MSNYPISSAKFVSDRAKFSIHQDDSTHEWILGHKCDLIVTIDDATIERCSMFFVEEEGTMSSFQGVREVIEKHGLLGVSRILCKRSPVMFKNSILKQDSKPIQSTFPAGNRHRPFFADILPRARCTNLMSLESR